MRFRPLAVLAALLAPIPTGGCIVIPVGDLLRVPGIEEETLLLGGGLFHRDKIVVIDVSGALTGEESSSIVRHVPNSVSEIKATLDRAAADRDVRAVVLRISSPGGEVTACDVIHREIVRFRERYEVPVVASIGDVGASGGYYVACAADRILAHPTSIVGSIGVILRHFDLSELTAKIGVRVDPVKSSDKKDIGSMFRRETPEERAILQGLVDDMYARFVEVVDAAREELDDAGVRELADGRVVSGRDAAELGLVDEVGYLDDAIDEAARLARVDSPTVVRYTRKAQVGSNIYTGLAPGVGGPSAGDAGLGGFPGAAELTLRWNSANAVGAGLYYLWVP